MYLKKIGKINTTASTHVEFEKIADDLVMISVDNNTNDQASVFSYWRLRGSGVNPPLEVGVNMDTGVLKSITLFLDNDCFGEAPLKCENISNGNIRIDTDIFTKQNDFFDIDGNYFVALIGGKLMCTFNVEYNIVECVINENIEIYLDDAGQIIGFAINDLSESALKTVKSLL